MLKQYIDVLYRDLGVNSRRKGNCIAELFGLYTPRDFKGVVQEFLAGQDSEGDDTWKPLGAMASTKGDLSVRGFPTLTLISLIFVFVVVLFAGATAHGLRYGTP